MIRLSRMSDYAVVLMTELSRRAADQPLASVSALAQSCHVQEPTVAKVLKQLARGGLTLAARGASGGYRLARPAADITIADIITAIDGPIALTSCVEEGDGCIASGICSMKGNWDQLNTAVRNALAGVTLAQMAVPSWSLGLTTLAKPQKTDATA